MTALFFILFLSAVFFLFAYALTEKKDDETEILLDKNTENSQIPTIFYDR